MLSYITLNLIIIIAVTIIITVTVIVVTAARPFIDHIDGAVDSVVITDAIIPVVATAVTVVVLQFLLCISHNLGE